MSLSPHHTVVEMEKIIETMQTAVDSSSEAEKGDVARAILPAVFIMLRAQAHTIDQLRMIAHEQSAMNDSMSDTLALAARGYA